MESIDVRQLGPEGTEFHWNEPATMLGLDSESEFQFPVVIDVKAQRIGTRVVVTGTVGCRVSLRCSMCLEPCEEDIQAEVAIELLEGPQPRKREDVVQDEDADVSYYTVPFIDLSDDLRQILLVAAPAYPVCRQDCQGLCPACGANRNTVPCGCQPASPARGHMAKAKPFEALGSLLQKELKGHG